MMKENINALDEISKGCSMGMDAINSIIGKVMDKRFSNLLNKQYAFYNKIKDRIDNIYHKYNKDDKPHETTTINKIITYCEIGMMTINDRSNSKIAELLLQGTNMGIIEGRRILNKKKINREVESIVDCFVSGQEKFMEVLKKYL